MALQQKRIEYDSQAPFPVIYKGVLLKNYFYDLIVELKAFKHLDDIERVQRINYPKVTGLHLGLLINLVKNRLNTKGSY